MTRTAEPSPWSADLTALCERLADRLRSAGADHPEAGAVAVAVRGRWGLDRRVAAERCGVTIDQLAAIEAGEVPWVDQPDPLRRGAAAEPGLDLARLGLA